MSHCIFEPFWSNLSVSIESLTITDYPPYKTNKIYINEGTKYLKIKKFNGNILIPCSVTVLSIEFASWLQILATTADYDYNIYCYNYPPIKPYDLNAVSADIYAASATIPDTVEKLTIKIYCFDCKNITKMSTFRINKFPAYLKELTIITGYYALLDNLNVETIKVIRVPKDYPYFNEIKAIYPDAIIKKIKHTYFEHEYIDHSGNEYESDVTSNADSDSDSDSDAGADSD